MKWLRGAIKDMHIPLEKEFKPVSIYLPEYQIPNLYVIEDEENQLSILFDANTKRINTLTFGFTGIEEEIDKQQENSVTIEKENLHTSISN